MTIERIKVLLESKITTGGERLDRTVEMHKHIMSNYSMV